MQLLLPLANDDFVSLKSLPVDALSLSLFLPSAVLMWLGAVHRHGNLGCTTLKLGRGRPYCFSFEPALVSHLSHDSLNKTEKSRKNL